MRRGRDLQRANLRANKWGTGINHHGSTEFVTVEKITNSTTGDTEECTTGDTIEETTDDHGLDVLRHCTRDQPDQEEGEGNDVDVSPAIELIKSACADISMDVTKQTSDKGPRKRGPTAIHHQRLPVANPVQEHTKTPDEERQSQRHHDMRGVELLHNLIISHSVHRRRTSP